MLLQQLHISAVVYGAQNGPEQGARGSLASLARLSPGLGVWASNVGSTGLSPPTAVLFPGQKVAASGEQRRARLGEPHIGAALVQLEPAVLDRAKPRRRSLVLPGLLSLDCQCGGF
jgi:hypothetical protein